MLLYLGVLSFCFRIHPFNTGSFYYSFFQGGLFLLRNKKYFIILIVFLIISILSYYLGYNNALLKTKTGLVEHTVDNLYALPYEKEKAQENAAISFVESLNDPYTEYLPKDAYYYFKQYSSSKYEGIGVSIKFDETKGAEIVDVIPSSPAQRVGIKRGDILISVDNKIIAPENFNDVISYIRGSSPDSPLPDEAMHFVLISGETQYSVDICRESYSVDTVESRIIDDDIFYIKLSKFAQGTEKEFSNALKNTVSCSSLILDLRDNGGGSVDVLLSIAEEILPKGLLFYSIDAKNNRTDYKIKDNNYLSIPLVVLVNENSASASEILASAISESGRGILIGQTTYGKGLVQAIIDFKDETALKLTVAKYYTLKGNYINDVGITPDILVENNENEDLQLNEALKYLSKNSETI